jgi:hypothetical protein
MKCLKFVVGGVLRFVVVCATTRALFEFLEGTQEIDKRGSLKIQTSRQSLAHFATLGPSALGTTVSSCKVEHVSNWR